MISENQIAETLGTYQVYVGRLRKKYGIPTITQTERLARQLPDALTSEQEQLLVGSLLGDGWMDATSNKSARFSDGHCWAQAAYTDWKAVQMEPFTSSRSTREGISSSGSPFKSRNFFTKSCTVLRPYYDLFYPAPNRKRVFPSDLYKRMTPFVLAIWYMDDGSLTTPLRNPRIAYGLGGISLKRALRALRTLGLQPKVYGSGGDQSIEFPKQAHQFRQIIEPHVPAVMAYKLPTETPRQEGDRNARKLSPEKASVLYTGGMSTKEIAGLYGVGEATVSRRLKAAGVKKRRSGPQRKAYTLDAAGELLGASGRSAEEWAEMSPTDQDELVSHVVGVLRASPFPFPVPFDAEAALKSLGKVRAAEMHVDESRIMPIRRVGIGCCTSLFPNRYKASSRGIRSAYEAWFRDKSLERAVRFQLRVGDPVLPHRVLRAVTMNCRTPTVFRPTLARFVYERFLPQGGRTWDPCMGYGGRLMGAAAAGVEYTATDVEPETVKGNQRLADLLGCKPDLHLCPAEEFSPPDVDLVFTSPPYFDRERYSERAAQSWVRYEGYEGWVEGFLRPVVQRARGARHLVLNINDVRVGKRVIPLVDTVLQVASEEGFVLKETLYLPLPKLNREDPKEPVLVFGAGVDHPRRKGRPRV